MNLIDEIKIEKKGIATEDLTFIQTKNAQNINLELYISLQMSKVSYQHSF